MSNHNDLLLKILQAVEYQDDKEVFVLKFEKNIFLQSIADLIKSLPLEKRDELKLELNQLENPEVALETLKNNFTDSQVQDAIKKSAKDSIKKYIQSINPTLSEPQKNNLMKVLKEIEQTSAQATF